MTSNLPSTPASRPLSGWVWLAFALVWVGVVRVPLILNARAHLDSDLAVDGLTLLDAVNGRWRWHYPATPFIGSPPVLLSIVQAKVWGTTPITLVTGGLVAWGLVVGATFWMNRRAFGGSVASWGLVPLAFASTGTIWLSGRVTGGHLLAVAWHAGAFGLLWGCLTRGGWRRALGLGLWSGFGLYIDTMFAVSWVGLGVGSMVSWWGTRVGFGRVFAGLLAFVVGAALGVSPRVIGQRVDPHDAYVGQFSPTIRGEIVAKNARLLALDCLPRLVAGHRLPWLEADPDPATLAGASKVKAGNETGIPWLALGVSIVAFGFSIVAFGFFGRGMIALLSQSEILSTPGKRGQAPGPSPLTPDSSGSIRAGSQSPFSSEPVPARLGIRWGLIVSSLAVVGGFLISPNITHSDNYRYLVFLLVPASTGTGLWLAKVASKGRSGVWIAWALTLGFAVLMTADNARWYARFGWVDSSFLPIRKEVRDPALDWLEQHREVSAILGDYWDVYRLAFLTEGRVSPVPFPQYPDRFPEFKRNGKPGQTRVVIVRPSLFGPEYRARAMALGALELDRGEGLSIVEWPERLRP
jgi:hypothetical protein